jgi:outer membrane protein OmpA-like peptidoglycan-associated protein
MKTILWAVFWLTLLHFGCSKPSPKSPGPAFDKVNGIPTASADAGRGRSELYLASSPKFPTVYFDFDSDRIRPEDLDRIASTVRDAKAQWVCYVDGHASTEGEAAYNLGLGARRASRVGNFIQSWAGITVMETSYGEERPAATPELSRRVEVRCE